MGQIAPDLLAAREERLALIRNPETRASAPKLRQFERDYAASLDQVDAARSKADAARAGADAARAGAADAWARADALEVQVAEMRRRKKEAEEAENEKKKAKPVSSFREFVGKTFRQIATFFRKFFGRS
jgi:hypothetical protein